MVLGRSGRWERPKMKSFIPHRSVLPKAPSCSHLSRHSRSTAAEAGMPGGISEAGILAVGILVVSEATRRPWRVSVLITRES